MTDKERLLTDLLDDGDGATFARAAAAHARRRRAVRHASLGLAAVALMAAVVFVYRPEAAPAQAATRAPAYEIISDQELLAQLKDERVMVLKDQNRITGVVFLAKQPVAHQL